MAQPPAIAPSRLEDLRRAFDSAFSTLPVPGDDLEDLLAVRVAGDAYIVRVREVAGLARAGKVVPLPSRDPALLGIASVRGGVVPVFSLSACLGYDRTREAHRWLLLCRTPTDTIALAVAEIEGHIQLPQSATRAAVGSPPSRPHTWGVVHTDAGARTVIDLGSLGDARRTRAPLNRNKER